MKNNLITVNELQELTNIINTKIVKDFNDSKITTLTTKLINSYEHYKQLSVELELKLEDSDYYV